MSDIITTIISLENACEELCVEKPSYISKMFERERDKIASENQDFMHLYLAGNHPQLTTERITDNDCLILYKTLRTNRFVRSIDLRYNVITDAGAIVIAKILEVNKCIEELNIMCNDFGPDGGSALAKCIHANSTLKVLRLNGNKIGNKGGLSFAQALQVNKTLESLDIGDADLTIQCLIALATVMRENKTLKALNVNRPVLWTISEEHTDHFTRMIKLSSNKTLYVPIEVNTGLKELHLQKFNMRDFGAFRIAENLVYNFTLTYLNLNCNRITQDGVKELAKVLKLNTSLKILDLGYNRIEDDGALFLAEAIGTFNTTLECLNIVYNNIGPLGLCAMADALNYNPTLTSLYIWGNHFNDSVCTAYAEHLHTERLLEHNCDISSYVVDGKLYLCQSGFILRRHYYYAPIYGDDVPEWQIRGETIKRSPHQVQIIQDLN